MAAILEHEVLDRREAMDAYVRGGQAERAQELQAEVDVLRRYLPTPR